ncbi:hypothetical protein [Spongiactinospora sp. TRM90649]|uniref:hypothetical protein n=1 Tax=Spongiactinospora sp. TRM90649 TaxID=3031114 RepID=UPI0023F61A32|nr:hypothetical protein [Spongiactinospora sp. TRM90649]MDF5756559.1 hypothetical protein [Spongiactinospora sp. TRM90649]
MTEEDLRLWATSGAVAVAAHGRVHDISMMRWAVVSPAGAVELARNGPISLLVHAPAMELGPTDCGPRCRYLNGPCVCTNLFTGEQNREAALQVFWMLHDEDGQCRCGGDGCAPSLQPENGFGLLELWHEQVFGIPLSHERFPYGIAG